MAIKIDIEFLKNRPVSFSALRHFVRSPKHYKHYLFGPRKKSPALTMGSAIDCLLLTEEKFKERFAIHPNYNQWTFDGKAMLEIFALENPGKILISKDEHGTVLLIKEAVMENSETRKVFDRITRTQTEYKWIDEETGIPCIAYTDAEGEDLTVELKSSRDASQNSFIKDAFNFGYHFQTGTYKIGQEACKRITKDYRYIVVEKEQPFSTAVYTPSPEYIEAGRKKFRNALRDFKYCLDNDLFDCSYEFWAGSNEALILDLPPWAKKKY